MERWVWRTTPRSCFDTSSIPKLSWAKATDKSSRPVDVGATGVLDDVWNVVRVELAGGLVLVYDSPARTALAYSLASNDGFANTA